MFPPGEDRRSRFRRPLNEIIITLVLQSGPELHGPIDMTATRAQCPLHLQQRSNIGTAAKRRFVPIADIWQRSKVSLYSSAGGVGGTSRSVVTTRTSAVRRIAERNVVAFKRDNTNISDRTVEGRYFRQSAVDSSALRAG